MSFSFNFATSELNEEVNEHKEVVGKIEEEEKSLKDGKSSDSKKGQTKEHSLESLMKSLPSKLSYTRIKVPIPHSDRSFLVYRRDLFDARFQMLHEDDDEEEEVGQSTSNKEWKAVMAGAATDLIPGVYEGGLKTWECSLDLAGVLAHRISESPDLLKGKKVIELGCGTAVPSSYLLSNALTHKKGEKLNLILQLCDFNEQVLRMVTLPNLLLTWYFYYHNHQDPDSDNGDVELSDEIIDEFLDSLEKFGITLQFYSGYWESLSSVNAFNSQTLPDIILTSETIYSMNTLPTLVDTLEEACNGSLEDGLSKTDLKSDNGNKIKFSQDKLCLVAAKVMYFGVGGGVYAFEQELKRRRAIAEPIWKSDQGVARVILQIHWRRK